MLLHLQNMILEMIATGSSLDATTDRLCREVERMVPDIVCSVVTVDNQGRIHPLAGPSLPEAYCRAVDGVAIGPGVGSCGTAAYTKQPVAVIDMENDPRWAGFADIPLSIGLVACWSSPIIGSDGRVVGTFAFYYREKRGPSALEEKIVETCLHLCVIAMELHQRTMEHHRLIFTDVMTNLPNRAAFKAAIAEIDGDPDARADWGLVLVDIDNLKITNDTFGHTAGDDLITTVAERISASAAPHRAFRLGGDEFAIITRGLQADAMGRLAANVLTAIKVPALCGGCNIFPSATMGGALPLDGRGEAAVIRQHADFALYHSKENSRGHFRLYHPSQGTTLTDRFRAVQDVTLALAEDRIEAFYQPTVRLDTGDIVGFEALCRMRTATGEIIPAAMFHEATKDARVAADLTLRMMTRVAADIRRWLDIGIPFQHVGLNVSSADFRSGRLGQLLREEFGRAGVPLKHVVLEVTESVYLGERDHVVADEIQALRAMGLLVALDDFGTGFASLTHLLTVPVDIIKIDKSFVDRLAPEDGGSAIVEGLIGIAGKLGFRVVAEGIETAAQAEQLCRLGCLLGQGYYYSRAVDRDAATHLLLQRGQRLPYAVQSLPATPSMAFRRRRVG